MKKIYLAVLFVIFAVSTTVLAQVGPNLKNKMNQNEPIEIVSDKMEAFQENRLVVFSGNAVATQGDIKMKTDRLSIYYKKSNDKKEQIGQKAVDGTGDLDRIEATENVVITQKDMMATGKEAVYYHDSGQFVLTGNPVLHQGKNIIKGCRVIFYSNESKGRVEPCAAENSGRVTATIQPQKKK
ncbi:MAG: lipopolysaccharide transport periplasmic protein LptA [Smithella sp.]|jgi:lipopolysaccharide export system protein LptA